MAQVKKHSRIVRKIAQTLVAWNVPYVFRHYPATNDPYSCGQEVYLADIIERALQGETIKKSEIEKLKADAEHRKAYCWQAEQEIHDLKYELDRRTRNAVSVCETLNRANQVLRDEISHLLAMQVVHFANEIKPPKCLNAFDALKWIARKAGLH